MALHVGRLQVKKRSNIGLLRSLSSMSVDRAADVENPASPAPDPIYTMYNSTITPRVLVCQVIGDLCIIHRITAFTVGAPQVCRLEVLTRVCSSPAGVGVGQESTSRL